MYADRIWHVSHCKWKFRNIFHYLWYIHPQPGWNPTAWTGIYFSCTATISVLHMTHVILIRTDRVLKEGSAEISPSDSGKKAMKHSKRRSSSTKQELKSFPNCAAHRKYQVPVHRDISHFILSEKTDCVPGLCFWELLGADKTSNCSDNRFSEMGGGEAKHIFETHSQFSIFQTVWLNVNSIPDVKWGTVNAKEYGHQAWKIKFNKLLDSPWQVLA